MEKMQDIEKAFNLIEAIDFSRFVEIMKGRTLSDLQFWFGDRVKELPNVNQIFEAKEQRRKGDKVLFEHSGNMPDMKFSLINALHKIAERLLFNEEHLNQIRTGDERFLNMPLIGQLWADSETLIKYRNVLLNWDSHTEKTKLFWAEMFGEITPEQVKEIISKVHTEAKNETEQDYFLTFESVKYWLMREGRILPRDFNEFWNWFVISYSDNLDEGITQVTREHILKFCKETETKLTEPTVRTTSTETSEQQEDTIDSILKSFLKLEDFQLETLKANLIEEKQNNIQLTYIGQKKKLWGELGKLRELGIGRRQIAIVFSDYCRWQKTKTSPFEILDYYEIYKKMK